MQLNALLTGSLKPLGASGVESGIDKQPVSTPLYLSRTGFLSDMQADRKHHGGPEKAVHHYPFEHYAFWRQTIGPRAVLDRPGAFGENISTLGMEETGVALGDTFRLGDAVIAVSQPRQPCWKLNIRFAHACMAQKVQARARTGWYYRVVEEGVVCPDDRLVLLERPLARWPLTRIWHKFYIDTMNMAELRELAQLPLLPQTMRKIASFRLQKQKTESWQERLAGKTTKD